MTKTQSQVTAPTKTPKKKGSLASLSLIFACISLIVNPYGLLSIAAITLGIIGLALACKKEKPIGKAIAGLSIGSAAIAIQFTLGTVLGILAFFASPVILMILLLAMTSFMGALLALVSFIALIILFVLLCVLFLIIFLLMLPLAVVAALLGV